jgi:hypothetical protein
LDLFGAHQAEVRLVNEGRRLERLTRLLLGQLLGGELTQLVVNQRQELLGGARDFFCDGGLRAQAVFNGREDIPQGVEFPSVSRRVERQRGLYLSHPPTL